MSHWSVWLLEWQIVTHYSSVQCVCVIPVCHTPLTSTHYWSVLLAASAHTQLIAITSVRVIGVHSVYSLAVYKPGSHNTLHTTPVSRETTTVTSTQTEYKQLLRMESPHNTASFGGEDVKPVITNFDLVSYVTSDSQPSQSSQSSEIHSMQPSDHPAMPQPCYQPYPGYPTYGEVPYYYHPAYNTTYNPAFRMQIAQQMGHQGAPQTSPPLCEFSTSSVETADESGYVSQRSSANPSPEPENSISVDSVFSESIVAGPHEPQEARPDDSYISMIGKAIISAPNECILLSGIYTYVTKNFPYFLTAKTSWKNCIRHNLSTNGCFVKVRRAESGKGFYWGIHETCIEAFRRGEFDRRQAKKLVQESFREASPPLKAEGAQTPEEETSQPALSPQTSYSSEPAALPAFCPMTCTPVTRYHPSLNWNVQKKLTKKQKTELHHACAQLLGY